MSSIFWEGTVGGQEQSRSLEYSAKERRRGSIPQNSRYTRPTQDQNASPAVQRFHFRRPIDDVKSSRGETPRSQSRSATPTGSLSLAALSSILTQVFSSLQLFSTRAPPPFPHLRARKDYSSLTDARFPRAPRYTIPDGNPETQ